MGGVEFIRIDGSLSTVIWYSCWYCIISHYLPVLSSTKVAGSKSERWFMVDGDWHVPWKIAVGRRSFPVEMAPFLGHMSMFGGVYHKSWFTNNVVNWQSQTAILFASLKQKRFRFSLGLAAMKGGNEPPWRLVAMTQWRPKRMWTSTGLEVSSGSPIKSTQNFLHCGNDPTLTVRKKTPGSTGHSYVLRKLVLLMCPFLKMQQALEVFSYESS